MIRRNGRASNFAGALCAGFALLPALACAVNHLPWECGGVRSIALEPGEQLRVSDEVLGTSGFAVVEERGVELSFAEEEESWLRVSFPGPRLGFQFHAALPRQPIAALILRSDGASATVARVSTGCRWRGEVDPNWFVRAQALARTVDPTSGGASSDTTAFDGLVATAFHPFQHAAAVHLRANAKYRATDYIGSAGDFALAAELWLRLGDRERAGAAVLGQADLLRRAGRHLVSRDLAIEALALLDTEATRYFRLRAKEALCLAHQWANELDIAADCFEDLPAEYLGLGEVDSFLNASVNKLSLSRDQGQRLDVDELDPAMRSALDSSAVTALSKGKVYLTLARLLRDQGEIAHALQSFDAALAQFSGATEDRERWVANTLLQVSGIYSELGMLEQAYEIHRDAMQGISARSAPARVGSALKWLAEIDRSAGDSDRALNWAGKSITLYSALGMPAELAISKLVRLELQAEMGTAGSNAGNELALIASDLTQPFQGRAQLLAAQLKLRSGDKRASIADLDALRQPTKPLSLQHEATLVAARVMRDKKRDREAIEALTSQVQRTTHLAQSVGNPALAYLMTRSLGGVRRELASLGLESATPQVPGEALWDSLLASQPLGKFRANPSVRDSSLAFSAEVSRKLIIGEGQWSRSAETLLLERLSGSKDGSAQTRTPELGDVRASLQPNDLLIMIVPAEPASLLWAVSADGEQRIRIAGRKELQRSVANLLKQIGAYRTAGPELDQAITEVSRSFLGGLANRVAPSRLFVLFDESIGDVPWAVLRWPGRDGPLVETTATSWISRIEQVKGEPVVRKVAKIFDVVVANPAAKGNAAGLQALPAAEMEASLIGLRDGALKPAVHQGEKASPEQLRASLRNRDGIVHLAAHGYSSPGLLGYAGVWLAPKPGTTQPQFLSWLDVADTPLEAGLAVLNACQLAAGPSASNASSLSFAGAISAAGVDQVVAALWPVSDAATVKWVPAFYSALDADDLGSSAEALRQAQMALRNSRHFRHPFYWASLAHFRHLEVLELAQARAR
jgi:tetratricopeptide (TPR) repeat protein